jgi:hypothetical protein
MTMNDLINDINVMQTVLIAMAEGASDEKRMALQSLESLMTEKQNIVQDYEDLHAPTDL